jgi:hypothetical protein
MSVPISLLVVVAKFTCHIIFNVLNDAIPQAFFFNLGFGSCNTLMTRMKHHDSAKETISLKPPNPCILSDPDFYKGRPWPSG